MATAPIESNESNLIRLDLIEITESNSQLPFFGARENGQGKSKKFLSPKCQLGFWRLTALAIAVAGEPLTGKAGISNLI